jgi:hypothetical protein
MIGTAATIARLTRLHRFANAHHTVTSGGGEAAPEWWVPNGVLLLYPAPCLFESYLSALHLAAVVRPAHHIETFAVATLSPSLLCAAVCFDLVHQ